MVGANIEPKIFRLCPDVKDGPMLYPRHVRSDVEGPRPEQEMAKASEADAGHGLLDLGAHLDVGDEATRPATLSAL